MSDPKEAIDITTLPDFIEQQTHGQPPDRDCLKGSDDKWEGYLLGVEEARHAAQGWIADRTLRRAAEPSPVLAVIERAESNGLEVTLWSYVREQRRLCEIELSGANDGPSVLDERTDDPKGSLDECARELLANWPEKN
jgi:hypothetical protein